MAAAPRQRIALLLQSLPSLPSTGGASSGVESGERVSEGPKRCGRGIGHRLLLSRGRQQTVAQRTHLFFIEREKDIIRESQREYFQLVKIFLIMNDNRTKK